MKIKKNTNQSENLSIFIQELGFFNNVVNYYFSVLHLYQKFSFLHLLFLVLYLVNQKIDIKKLKNEFITFFT